MKKLNFFSVLNKKQNEVKTLKKLKTVKNRRLAKHDFQKNLFFSVFKVKMKLVSPASLVAVMLFFGVGSYAYSIHNAQQTYKDLKDWPKMWECRWVHRRGVSECVYEKGEEKCMIKL